ncbi:MAG: hypothetical protein RSA90_03940 [Lachnospiraceae bacterium]
MYEGNVVELKMKRSILIDGEFDSFLYRCKIFKYDKKKECIYLLLGKEPLVTFSLDAIYTCCIKGQEEELLCDGIVVKRYENEAGKIIEFAIRNGFYKNNIK